MATPPSDHTYLTLPAPVLNRDVEQHSPLLQGSGPCRRELREVIKMLTPGSYSNLLLVFIPLGILNLRKTRRLSAILGPMAGGCLHALLDNAPLLIIGIAAIQHGAAHIAQSCIMGSVLANLLLVVGWCFLVGSMRHRDLIFSTTFASTASSLMMVASTSLVVPSAISEVHCSVDPACKDKLVRMSHTVSLGLLFLFVVYQHYRWRSHRQLFMEATSPELIDRPDTIRVVLIIFEALLLIAVLGMSSLSAYFLMRTMSSVTDSDFLNKRVVSFVLLPLAMDGPARIEAVAAAYNNHMTAALEFAIGRSMNVALFITPALVLFSWVAQSSYPMTLHFPTLETMSVFLGTLLVAELCRDGKSDYLEGAMCLVTSVICQVLSIVEAVTDCLHRYVILSFSF
ncbi:Ca2+ transporter [Trichoderma gracile]